MRNDLCALLTAALCAVGVVSCGGKSNAPGRGQREGRALVPVRLAAASVGDVRQAIEYTADIRARDEAVVFSRVPGKIQARVLEDGTAVKKGDVIAWVDRDEVGLKYERAPVEAPLDGVIGRVYIDRGTSVTPQTPVALVVDMSDVRAELDVPERYLPLLSTNLTAEASVDAWPGQVFTGTVRKVSPVVDIDTRTAPAEIRIPNADGRLKPGMFARLRLVLRERRGATLVPREAVMGKGSEAAVYVVTGGTARLRKVRAGLRQGSDVEIEDGLQPGEQVVTMGQQRLADGATVLVDAPNGGGAAGREGGGAGRK